MKRIIILISCLLVFSSCENKPQDSSEVKVDTVSVRAKDIPQNTAVEIAQNTESRNWIDDFRDFRNALYANDTAKLKTYFDFPISDEESSILTWCRLTEAERKSRAQEVDNPDLFYEKDFDRYYKRIFNKNFLSGILKIKSAVLLSKGEAETKEIPDSPKPFVMYASMDKELKTLEFNMAFRNGTDDDGNYVSEGEYNVIYVFDVIDGRKLMFKKIAVAG